MPAPEETPSAPMADPPPALPAKRPLEAARSQEAAEPTAPAAGPPPPSSVEEDDDDNDNQDGPPSAKRARLLEATQDDSEGGAGDSSGEAAGPSGLDKGKGRELAPDDAPAADAAASDKPAHSLASLEPTKEEKVEQPQEQLERLVDELESELSCPVCSAVLYKPVTIQPGCGHAFCGACLHGYLTASSPAPHICPSCRTPSTSASHSRIVATMVDVLVAHAPDRARTQTEKDQADDVWDIGMPLRFGAPPPPPERIRPSECYRPCRFCPPNNGFGWSCPIPVPSVGSDGPLYPLDGPTPPGHFQCASCTRLAASEAPSTTSCSICEAHYCGAPGGHSYYGNGEGGVCSPQTFTNSKPGEGLWGRSALDLCDSIMDGQSDEMMNAFRDNTEELSIFARYIGTHPEHTPTALWAEMLEWIQSNEGQSKGGVKGIFRRTDEGIHYGFRGETPERTCKACTDDIFACGLYEWWERKRPTVLSQLDKAVQRPNCKNGRNCYRQGGTGDHARKFNHVCAPAPPEIIDSIAQDDGPPVASASTSTSASVSAAGSSSNLAEPSRLFDVSPTTSSQMLSAVPAPPSESAPIGSDGQTTGEALSSDADHSLSVEPPAAGPPVDMEAPSVSAPPQPAADDSSDEEHDQETMVVDEPNKLDGLPGVDEPVLGDAIPRPAVAAAV